MSIRLRLDAISSLGTSVGILDFENLTEVNGQVEKVLDIAVREGVEWLSSLRTMGSIRALWQTCQPPGFLSGKLQQLLAEPASS